MCSYLILFVNSDMMLLPLHNVYTDAISVQFDLELPVSLSSYVSSYNLPDYIVKNFNTSQ